MLGSDWGLWLYMAVSVFHFTLAQMSVSVLQAVRSALSRMLSSDWDSDLEWLSAFPFHPRPNVGSCPCRWRDLLWDSGLTWLSAFSTSLQLHFSPIEGSCRAGGEICFVQDAEQRLGTIYGFPVRIDPAFIHSRASTPTSRQFLVRLLGNLRLIYQGLKMPDPLLAITRRAPFLLPCPIIRSSNYTMSIWASKGL